MVQVSLGGWFSVAVAAIILVPHAGCRGESSAPGVPARPAATTEAAKPQAPTDEECRQFAAAVEKAAASGNASALSDAIDNEAILDKVTGGVQAPESVRQAYIRATRTALEGNNGHARVIVNHTAAGGSFQLLRIHREGNEKRALFRFLLSQDAGVNYYDMVLKRHPDGKIRAVDIYCYLPGEMTSTTLRRFYLASVPSRPADVADKSGLADNEHVKYLPIIQSIAVSVRTGLYQQALDTYAQLPLSLKKDKSLLKLRLVAAQHVDPQHYQAAIDDFRRFYPDDPAVDFVLIDGHLLKGEYAEALKCTDRMDKAVGGDPYLNVIRANCYIFMADLAKAQAAARKAVEGDDRLQPGYAVLMTISLKKKDFEETTRLLELMDRKFGPGSAQPANDPEYEDYVRSPQYGKWLKSRTASKRAADGEATSPEEKKSGTEKP